MNAKERLIQEIESSSELLIEELLDFLIFTRARGYLRSDLPLPEPQTNKPIWEVAQELMSNVPQEIIDQLPVDGAEQHDHYIYGTPKQNV